MASLQSKVHDCINQLDVGLDTDRAFDARMTELNLLSKELRPKSKRLSLLRLPRYMRRRAASHNPRRLPKRFRYVGSRLNPNITSHVTKKRKRLKKHLGVARRRKSAHKRNQKSNRHLLHIWFRKRFELRSLFGVYSAWQNNTKNFRLLCRQTHRQCVFFHLPHHVFARLTCEKSKAANLSLMLSQLSGNCFTHRNRLTRKEITLPVMAGPTSKQLLGIVRLVRTDSNSDTIELLVSTSMLANEIVFDCLKSGCIQHEIAFSAYKNQFQRFRVLGTKAAAVLSHTLHKIITEENQTSSSPKLFESVKLFEDKESRVYSWNANDLFDGPRATFRAVVLDMALDSRRIVQCVDLLVPSNCAKRFWYTLVQNRAHLVGGLRNLMYFSLERKMAHFPFVGASDCIAYEPNRQRQRLMRKIEKADSESSSLHTNDYETLPILRHLATLELLVQGPSKLDEVIEKISNLEEQLVVCHLQMIRRGVLTENDLLYLPTCEDLSAALAHLASGKRKHAQSDSGDEFEPIEISKLSILNDESTDGLGRRNRRPIGCVEYGEFCLQSGRGEASAIVLLRQLVRLMQMNVAAHESLHATDPNRRSKRKKNLLVLVREKSSNRYRFAELSIKVRQWFA